MKIRFYLATAIVALSWMGCSQEEATNEIMSGANVIQATIESSSRSAVTDAGAFSWTTGDKISLLDDSNNDTYTYSGTGNGFNPPASGTVSTPVVAYYPANENHNTTEFYLPDTYGNVNTEYVASTNAAMIATPPTTGNTTYAFMHLGGVMRFNVKNVPVNADGFQFTVSGKKITGAFEVKSGTEKTIETAADPSSNNTVTIRFEKLTEAKDMTFYVPMPTGTYNDYTVGLFINDDLSGHEHTSTNVTNTIARKTLLLMPTFTWNGTSLDKGEAIAGVIDLEDGNQSANITGDAEVVVTPGTDADAVATLNYTPANDGSSVLSISDGSGATESGESKGKVLVSTANGSTVASCDINTPSLTVELSAGTYGTIEALTAKQTLIIGDGVTIEELILNGGALEIAEGATNVTIGNIVVKDELGLKSAVAAGGAVKLGDNITIENTDGISVGNGKTVTLDLNGKDVTAQGDGLVAGTGTTLTLNATNGGSLTAGATVGNWVAVWANGGTITINGGTYHVGLDQTDSNSCIYAKNGGYITVNGGSFSHEVPTSGNNYGMPLQVNNAKNSGTIIVKGGTYTLDNGRYYEAQDRQHGAIIIAGTESTENDITTVTANTTDILTETALKSATGSATLNADICLTSSMTISSDITIDLNGYYIVSQSADAFAVNSGTLTLNDNSTGKTGHVVASPYDDQSANAVWANGGKVVINGGTYLVGDDTNADRNDCIYVGKNGANSTIEINGGTFQYTGKVSAEEVGTNHDGHKFLINQYDSHTEQLITIYGGVFHNFNPSNAETNDGWMTDGKGSYVANGYSSSTSDNGATYQVTKD